MIKKIIDLGFVFAFGYKNLIFKHRMLLFRNDAMILTLQLSSVFVHLTKKFIEKIEDNKNLNNLRG